jgi:hypothetical protein
MTFDISEHSVNLQKFFPLHVHSAINLQISQLQKISGKQEEI